MTPEEHAKLDRAIALAEENNKMLKSIRLSSRIGTVMHVVYWVVIILFSVGAWYLFQPYLTFLTGVAAPSGSSGAGSTGSSTGQGSELQTMMDSLQQAQGAANSLKDLLK